MDSTATQDAVFDPVTYAGLGRTYTLGPLIEARIPNAYRRSRSDPRHRPLRIFTTDPSTSALEGNVALAYVPYEPLKPGPMGRLFEVRCEDPEAETQWQQADLDDQVVMLDQGYDPSEADPRFLQQMVYAVCSLVHRSFRHALGRELGWAGTAAIEGRLKLYPFGMLGRNAYYDPTTGELRFGYFRAGENVTGRTLPRSFVFTALSHDIIAHELTHALLDGLRAQFAIPSGPDVASFHEGLADLVALFHHFDYRDALRTALRKSRGDIRDPLARYLHEIAQQFGRAGGDNHPLRSAINIRIYDDTLECHELGEVLLGTVFDAFCTVYGRKSNRTIQLATGGSGVLPPGEIHPLLLDVLVEQAAALARQFLSIIIRAIDYCPPVDLHFGEFLQAMITADRELVTDDKWGYREALIDTFRERGVHLRNVPSLSESSLLWRPPRREVPPIPALSFAELKFDGEPGRAAGPEELKRQACALAQIATHPQYMEEFGLVSNDDERLGKCRVELPRVESIRSVRRIGPDGQAIFDLVAEITQRCVVPREGEKPGFSYWGGSTVLIDADGHVRYTILKSVAGEGRLARRRAFLEDARSSQFWTVENVEYKLLRRGFCARSGATAHRRHELLHRPIWTE